MGVAGTMAFAPLGASPSVAGASETVDQINTKADGENIKYAPSALGLDPENDPVIYTTESGLEIKYGGVDLNNSLASGKPLSGYPYFTMGTYGGYAVNWVIIGRNTNDTVFTSAITNYLFSNWKTNTNLKSATYATKGYYFFNNTYETTTPAGSAINGVVPSKSYVADVTKVTKTVVGNAEVPSGCVLAISECCLGTSLFNSSNNNYQGSTLQSTLSTYYSSSLGLTSAQKALIKPQTLWTHYGTSNASPYPGVAVQSTSQYLFPLAYSYTSFSNFSSLTAQNYFIATFLTSNALRIAYSIGTTTARDYWTRSGSGHSDDVFLVKTNGAFDVVTGAGAGINYNSTLYIRPACVIKLG